RPLPPRSAEDRHPRVRGLVDARGQRDGLAADRGLRRHAVQDLPVVPPGDPNPVDAANVRTRGGVPITSTDPVTLVWPTTGIGSGHRTSRPYCSTLGGVRASGGRGASTELGGVRRGLLLRR